MSELSLVFICYRRPNLLRNSLESVRRQTIQPNEIILMEDGDDGGETAQIAKEFGCHHLQHPRDDFPLFGNLPAVRNLALKTTRSDYICIQDSEIRYQNSTALDDMMESSKKSFGIVWPRVVNLNENGIPSGWYSYDRTFFGGGPYLGKRSDFLRVGGWDEQFEGYGFDDHFFLMCLRKNGISYSHALNAIAEHQWHTRVPHELTGFANRSRINILEYEIEHGIRPPVANWGPLVSKPLDDNQIRNLIHKYIPTGLMLKTVEELLILISEHYSTHQRYEYEVCWALKRAQEIQETATKDPRWSPFVESISQNHLTWASISLQILDKISHLKYSL